MKNRFKFSRVKSGGIIIGFNKKKNIADFIVPIGTDSKYIYWFKVPLAIYLTKIINPIVLMIKSFKLV